MYDQLFKNILSWLEKEGLINIALEKDYSCAITITGNGTKAINELELKIRLILTING
jgi:predicted transcriptional regulator